MKHDNGNGLTTFTIAPPVIRLMGIPVKELFDG